MIPTPKQSGFIMPAEWERHSAVWLAWPYDETTFPKRLPAAEAVFVEVIKALYDSEKVKLLILDTEMEKHATKLLENTGVDLKKIDFIKTKFADVWTRDYGPVFLVNREKKSLAWTKWEYNGYGKGDDPYFAPVLIDNEVFNNLDLPGEKFETKIVLEGGAIDVNGKGLCLTTEQTLMNPNRNAKSKMDTEKYLADYLGIEKTIWLKEGLINDHTDGHIDEIARFVSANKILCAYEDNTEDENFKILDDNYQVLKNATDQNGKSFEIIKLPMPHMLYDDGIKAPVSYCNFYIANDIVLMSKFNDENDAKAQKIIQDCFPDRKVVAIDCREIIYGGGAIHCMTQQQPAV
jgi:agmatine deiminase